MKYTNKDREYYNLQRYKKCEHLGITVNQYNTFRRIGMKLHKIYEDDCNGLHENEQVYENLCSLWEKKANELASKLGLHIFYQTDPRGATVYLDREPIPENNYTRAHCIY